MKKKYKDLLNKVSGYIVILAGILMIFNLFKSGLGSLKFLNIFFGIALIFLGTYVLKYEKWAVILSGVYGIALLINMYSLTKLVGWNALILILHIPMFILIINWSVFFHENDKQ